MSSEPELLAVLCDPFLITDEAIARVTDDDDEAISLGLADDWVVS